MRKVLRDNNQDDTVRPVWRLVVTLSAALIFVYAVVILASYQAQGKNPVAPVPGGRASALIAVQNTVVESADGQELDKPLYLSRRPVPRCADPPNNCAIPDSQISNNAVLTAVCYTLGAGMTNMDLRFLSTKNNPARVSSNTWYGVRAHNGELGYVSEVYLTPASRGGLGLGLCPS